METSKSKINGLLLLMIMFFALLALSEATTNSTRRQLAKKYKGPCLAANAIDKCWRCDPHWADNRKKLADCALGFGRKAIGGKFGRFYVVTDPSDDNVVEPRPGTLRHAALQKEPLWIIFGKHMHIRLQRELIITSYKTIDARGVNVHIEGGAGLKIQFAQHVIISNLHIHHIVPTPGGLLRESVDHVGIRGGDEGDGISIFKSRFVWIDHVSMSRATDGLIDAVQASTAITISNCHFTDHNKVMLFGANDFFVRDRKMRVTLAYNHFGKRLDQRMPRCRFGFFHLVNNDYTHWERYAIGGSMGATIISQGNRFIAQSNLIIKEVTYRDKTPVSEWMKWTWISDGDDMQNGAFFTRSGDQTALRKYRNLRLLKPEPAHRVGILTRFSGSLGCTVGHPC